MSELLEEAFKEWQRERVSKSTKEGLRRALERGVKLGRPRRMSPEAVAIIHDLRDRGFSYQTIASILNGYGLPTAQKGKAWYPQTVRTVYLRGISTPTGVGSWHPSGIQRALSYPNEQTGPQAPNGRRRIMAKKQVLICDACDNEIDVRTGGLMRANPFDARKTSKAADLCESCLDALPGNTVVRRGRKPKPA